MRLADLFERVDLTLENETLANQPVYFGGPVQTERGHASTACVPCLSTLKVSEWIGLTSSKDILESIARAGSPSDVLITLGYAGWEAGQLENEILQNAWLTVPADPHILLIFLHMIASMLP